jgi:hypothetical protein
MSNPPLFSNSWWFEWGITALLIVGVILTSFNIYPLNLYVLLISNLGWVIQALIWRKSSLFVVQSVVTGIYVIGIANTWLV